MLERLLRVKEALKYISKNTDNLEFKELYFTSTEWFFIQQLKDIFEIFIKPSIRL